MNGQIDTSKLVVVCLHSLFLTPGMFDELKARFGDETNIIAPTFPGQAERLGEAAQTITIEDCASDVLTTLDNMDVGTFSIVGQSMGGDVALRLATMAPERVERMVLMGSSACAEPDEQRAGFEQMAVPMADHGVLPELADILLTILLGASTLADPQKASLVAATRKQLLSLPPEFIHAARGVIERSSYVDRLPEIAIPTLVISGTEDPARPPAWSDELFAGIPDSQLWRIKRVGHSPILEAPELVIPRIGEFLQL